MEKEQKHTNSSFKIYLFIYKRMQTLQQFQQFEWNILHLFTVNIVTN